MSTMRPEKPLLRRVSAAFAPARLAPTMTKVRSSLMLESLRRYVTLTQDIRATATDTRPGAARWAIPRALHATPRTGRHRPAAPRPRYLVPPAPASRPGSRSRAADRAAPTAAPRA